MENQFAAVLPLNGRSSNPTNNVVTIKEPVTQHVARSPTTSSQNIPLCRICLSEEFDDMNPLFSPCKCSGSMKYVHLTCLGTWISSKKVTKETAFCKTYFWKNLECELCKTVFPNNIKAGAQNVTLRVIQYELPVYEQGEEP